MDAGYILIENLLFPSTLSREALDHGMPFGTADTQHMFLKKEKKMDSTTTFDHPTLDSNYLEGRVSLKTCSKVHCNPHCPGKKRTGSRVLQPGPGGIEEDVRLSR